jgi:hypothetical protein
MKITGFIVAAAFLFSSVTWGASPEVHLTPVGDAERIFNRADVSPTGLTNSPVMLHLTVKTDDASSPTAQVSWTTEDIFGKPVGEKEQASVNLQKGEGQQDLPFKAPGPGYFLVKASIQVGPDTASAWTDFGIVPPPYPGLRPDSFFASNTSWFKKDADLDLLKAIGMKVERVEFYPTVGKTAGLSPGEVPSLDFTHQDEQWREAQAHGLWALPMMGYALEDDKSKLAEATGMYGPPGDDERFANTWAAILKHYPEITTVEMWNEPWIFGWTFAGTPQEYCHLQQVTMEKVLAQNPKLRLIGGSSTAYIFDNIEPYAYGWKGLLQGISNHPYSSDVNYASFRGGANFRLIDCTQWLAKRMKLPYAYITEGGSLYNTPPAEVKYVSSPKLQAILDQVKAINDELATLTTPDQQASPRYAELKEQLAKITETNFTGWLYPDLNNNNENAAKIIQYFVKSAIDGEFQGDAQWKIGYGDGWTRCNTAFAVMTHFLEDRPVVADIWPANELIWGGVFANPKFVTGEVKALPRAEELAERWRVAIPDARSGDKTKVAVSWSLTGESNRKLDSSGTLTIPQADGLQAWDMTGREILSGSDGLTVPFTSAPVYITSDKLSVVELRRRVAHGIIKNVTPVNLYALSLLDDPAAPRQLSVRVENQLNVPLKGTLHLKVDGSGQETSVPFSIDATKLVEVPVSWPADVPANANNQYGVTLSAEVTASGGSGGTTASVTVQRQQVVSVARFAKRTITFNGSVDDWKGLTPVLLDSNLLNQETDMSQYLLNPGLDKATGNSGSQRIVTRVYTAYDQGNVYLGAAVNEDTFHCSAGEPAIKGKKKAVVPYKNGMPDGLGHAIFCGDVFQVSFGFRDRVPGWGRQMDDPYAWKGDFYDVDNSYVAHASTEGDKLIRIWSPATNRQNGYQTVAIAGQGPVPGGKIKISRDEAAKLTLYEVAIPRSELKLFDPANGRCRFGFVVYNSEKVGGADGLSWSDAAGVFDYWRNMGSFPPSWTQHTACQTFFGIEK